MFLAYVFIINLSKSIVQTHFFFCTQIIWELLLPWNILICFAVLPKFEVKVELPPYLLEKEKALHGKVTVRCVKIRLRGKCIITINLLLTLMVHTIFKRSWILVVVLKRSLNSVKVLEKYLISLLGLEKSLKFTTLCMPDTRFL